jgi:hypothetical protein
MPPVRDTFINGERLTPLKAQKLNGAGPQAAAQFSFSSCQVRKYGVE